MLRMGMQKPAPLLLFLLGGIILFAAWRAGEVAYTELPWSPRAEALYASPDTREVIFRATNEYIESAYREAPFILFERYRLWDPVRGEYIDLDPNHIIGFFAWRPGMPTWRAVVDRSRGYDIGLQDQVTADFAYPYNIWPWPQHSEFRYVVLFDDGRAFKTKTTWPPGPQAVDPADIRVEMREGTAAVHIVGIASPEAGFLIEDGAAIHSVAIDEEAGDVLLPQHLSQRLGAFLLIRAGGAWYRLDMKALAAS